jgi:hypothetical protein
VWKAIVERIDELRLKLLPDAMAEAEIRTLTIDGVGRVQLAMDAYVSIVDKPNAYTWLSENGYEGLIQPYAQPGTLKATVKAALKDGHDFPEELFKVQPFVRASIVKR